MAVIGPRPTVPVQVEQYTDRQRGRLAVKPGITGWAQVNGLRGDTPIEDRVRYDLYYVENWSILFDIKIIMRTLVTAFRRGNNAY
jgi:lipopolysaccharide/colanic/teichoic acid biosynthesis glycosyltransferase